MNINKIEKIYTKIRERAENHGIMREKVIQPTRVREQNRLDLMNSQIGRMQDSRWNAGQTSQTEDEPSTYMTDDTSHKNERTVISHILRDTRVAHS